MTEVNLEKLVDRWEDRREVKNIMGKFVHYLLLNKTSAMVNDLWSRRDDIAYGINEGWYNGREAVAEYFGSFDAHTAKVAQLLKKKFPDKLEGLTDEELFGTGVLNLKSVSNYVIEVADDGETAKGIACLFGYDTNVDEHGPVSNWIFGTMAVDFIIEDEDWKIWHMQYLEDINNPSGQDWGEKDATYPFPEYEEFAELKGWAPPAPNVPVVLRERYSGTRPFAKLPQLPVPYATFAETFSYGPKEV